jgi:hypothetical protein
VNGFLAVRFENSAELCKNGRSSHYLLGHSIVKFNLLEAVNAHNQLEVILMLFVNPSRAILKR